jgi:hypothetical protein
MPIHGLQYWKPTSRSQRSIFISPPPHSCQRFSFFMFLVTFLISSDERYTFCPFNSASFNRPNNLFIPLLPLSYIRIFSSEFCSSFRVEDEVLYPYTRNQQRIRAWFGVFFTVVPCVLILLVFYYQLMHKRIALKEGLKFTLKQVQHVSV